MWNGGERIPQQEPRTNEQLHMCNYADDEGRRERLRAWLEREKDERRAGAKKVLQRERGRRMSGKRERRATNRGGGGQ